MRPLEGVKVLEMGQLIAGPFCGQILADFGAEVVKIEPPGRGDAMRQWGPVDADGNAVWWAVIGRNKKSMTLDLRQKGGQQIARSLAAEADILVENFRVGTLERWGLGWEALSGINQRLIMVRVTGFGQTGPYAQRAGFASVCEAMGGLRYISGYPDRPPVRAGLSLGDSLAGLHAALGAILALQARDRTGRGQVVDASIFESVLAMTESLVAEYDRCGHVRQRSGSTLPGIAPSNAYPTRDDKEVIIGANQDTVFRRLCAEMGQPGLADDPRYASHRARGERQEELDEAVADWTRQHDAEELVERLAASGVPAGLAYRAPEMLDDPHFLAREAITRVHDPRFGDIAMQNVFPRLSESPGTVRQSGPALGEHTEDVLRDWLGFSEGAIASLARSRVI
ncbi:MAG TPA: CaiB/BaiF CoA-transferase family protein [Gammaproteobacteria bacterium]|nr:CaiB/BaiF CoA-transferase family protein [Gammaproteobacteria bacterium]